MIPSPERVSAAALPDDEARKQFEQLFDWITGADVAFLSITKSGRTWVRFFLQKYFGRLAGEELDLRPRVMKQTTVSPSICFTADFYDFYESKEGEPRLVFGPELRERPMILMIRDPRDVVVSYFHWARHFIPKMFEHHVGSGKMDDFIRSPVFGIERIARFHEIELDLYAKHPGPKCLLSYEQLWLHRSDEFRRLVHFLRSDAIDEAAFAFALEASEFKAMQEFEIGINKQNKWREFLRLGIESWSGDTNALKVRQGGIGSFHTASPELSDADILRERYPITHRLLTRLPSTTTNTSGSA